MLWEESLDVIKAEFDKKDMILANFGERVSAVTLYEDLFGDTSLIMPVLFIDDEETKHVVKMSIDEALEQAEDRADILLGASTYFKEFVSKETAKDVYGFIIDMDNVWAGVLLTALQNDWNTDREKLPKPTYIVNSGTGLHLYFMLDTPIPHYKCNAEAIDQLYRALAIQQTTSRIYLKREVQWFGQDFRMAGSLNKYGWRNEAFKIGQKWNIDELGRMVGMKDVHFVRPGEPRIIPALQRGQSKNRLKRTGWRCYPGFYNYTLERCRKETKEGNRYMSMCALAVIAWKCNVPVDKVERDLLSLIPTYNEGATRQIKEKEIKHALRMYNEKAIITPRQRLEDWIGWEYHPIKRNGRKQTVHLTIARATRDILHPEGWQSKEGRPTMQHKIAAYRAEHPDATPKDCIAETGLSKNTVYRWWGTAPELEEADDNLAEVQVEAYSFPADLDIHDLPSVEEWFQALNLEQKNLDGEPVG